MDTRSERGLYAAALCAIGAFGIALPAAAGDEPGCDKAAHIDAEGGANGQISASEHAASAQKRFEAMDADHDGKITDSEITASQGAERIAWARNPTSGTDRIRSFDRNKDGVLSVKEYADGSQAMFDKLDSNSDGYLKAAEMNVDRMSAHDGD
ncbi:EF-hand domain-containing protein [Povalibacter sp.]|uniref:EF-hand domain-containing protein n=1 Tax=Povalibacter sp. TaxID=1962978 RepID=UPI002F41A287